MKTITLHCLFEGEILLKKMLLWAIGLILLTTVSCSAKENKKEVVSQSKEFILSVILEDNILKTKAIKRGDVLFLKASNLPSLFKELKAKSQYDPEGKILTIFYNGKIDANLPSVKEESVTIVINGKIHRVPSICIRGKRYISASYIKEILRGMGYSWKYDKNTNIVTVIGRNKKQSTEKSARRDASPKEIKRYMNTLKRLFREYKPKNFREISVQAALGDKKNLKSAIKEMKNIQKECEEMVARIDSLTPPNDETRKVHNLALSIFRKIAKFMELSQEILESPPDVLNPKAVEKLQKLNREILKEQVEFDNLVIKIRNKYKLGPP